MTSKLSQISASDKPNSQNRSALKRVFRAITDNSCPYFYNFHMHTVHSDGKLQPEALIEQAIAIGLKGLAITDHHRVSGYQAAQRWLEEWRHQDHSVADMPQNAEEIPNLWTGVEITSHLLETEVHILGYAFNPEHPCLKPYLQGRAPQGQAAEAFQVITAIQEAGGLAVLAHPARYRRSPEELILEAAHLGIDGVETYYAYTNPSPWKPSPQQTQKVKQLSEVHNLLSTCGTDTHGLSLLQRL